MLSEDGLPVLEEVLVEDGVLGVIGLDQGGVEASNLFGFWRKVDDVSWGRLSASVDSI